MIFSPSHSDTTFTAWCCLLSPLHLFSSIQHSLAKIIHISGCCGHMTPLFSDYTSLLFTLWICTSYWCWLSKTVMVSLSLQFPAIIAQHIPASDLCFYFITLSHFKASCSFKLLSLLLATSASLKPPLHYHLSPIHSYYNWNNCIFFAC